MDQIPFLKKYVATEIKGIAAIYIMLSHLVSSPWWWMGLFLFGGGVFVRWSFLLLQWIWIEEIDKEQPALFGWLFKEENCKHLFSLSYCRNMPCAIDSVL